MGCLPGVGLARFMKYTLIMPISMHGMFQSDVARQHGDPTITAIVPYEYQGGVYRG